ncbi:MAG TPA: aldehyde dehydrogenase family protein, partial [Ferruginibacter sp.]|nr:aldehyde dehydrogenase family protein [Ferruginibacter sp.]
MTYPDILPNQINDVVQQSANAFMIYNQYTLQKRVELLYTIAHLLDQKFETLIASAASETQLSITRLKTELSRTCWQLKSY